MFTDSLFDPRAGLLYTDPINTFFYWQVTYAELFNSSGSKHLGSNISTLRDTSLPHRVVLPGLHSFNSRIGGVEELLSQPATRSASPARTVVTRRDVTWRL